MPTFPTQRLLELKMKLKLALLSTAIIAVGLFSSMDVVAHPASGIVLDRAGNIYFSDLETIWKIDISGKLSVFRAGVSGRHVHELAIDQQDNIYGADLSYELQKFISDVWKMTPDGKFAYLLEPTDKPPRAMSIWRDREGNSYWIDQNNHTKTQTLLLRRTPDGSVTTLAGGAYGYADGKGTAAKFSTVGNMAFGPDGDIYLSDGEMVRKVAMDGTVTTLAKNLGFRTAEDKPTLFERSYGDLAGINVDLNGNVYVADASNRRLLKISQAAKVDVVLRTDPPFFPNGVVAAKDGSVFVLEVGFTLPNTSSGPRVRKLGANGKSTIMATVGESNEASSKTVVATLPSVVRPVSLASFAFGPRTRYGLVLLSAGVLCTGAFWWQRRRRQRG
jgi:hypothetical protein